MIRWRVTKTVMFVGPLGGASCASNQGAVRGDGTSAEEHRAEAAKLSARADAPAHGPSKSAATPRSIWSAPTRRWSAKSGCAPEKKPS